jgi:hypothetical protein
MRSPIRRHILVLALILATGLAEVGLGVESRASAALPQATALLAGSGWQVEAPTLSDVPEKNAQQWLLHDAAGDKALLYVETTGFVQRMFRWSGELGYQGDGFVVSDRGEREIRLADGRAVAIGHARVERLGGLLFLEYAVVSPDGVEARGTDSLVRTAWNALRGQPGPFYLVRVAVMPGGNTPVVREGDQLLATVLTSLLARFERGTSARGGTELPYPCDRAGLSRDRRPMSLGAAARLVGNRPFICHTVLS